MTFLWFVPCAVLALVALGLAYSGMFVSIRDKVYTEYHHELQVKLIKYAAAFFLLACIAYLVV